jgi:hypothetical protein
VALYSIGRKRERDFLMVELLNIDCMEYMATLPEVVV